MTIEKTTKRLLALILSVAILFSLGFGARVALRSPLFTLEVVELADQPPGAPLDARAIHDLAAVPVGKVNLLDLDLAAVEKRILAEPWVREVSLTKRFPQSLEISVRFRQPRALLQHANGSMSYVDADGTVFGRVNLIASSDLPVLSGFEGPYRDRLAGALHLLTQWSDSNASRRAQISSLGWDRARGFRMLVSYPMGANGSSRARTMVDFGHEIDSTLPPQLDRVAQVLGHLSSRSIAARQIWADSGKKIVVKTSHGS